MKNTKIHPINYLLILSIIFLPATKLKIYHTSIPLNIILLLLYCLFTFIIGIKITPSFKLFLKLFVVLGFCFGTGFIVNKYTLHNINLTTWHNTLAYILILVFIFALNCKKVELGECIKISSIIIPIFYAPFIFNLNYWYQHFRFSGLSNNPNQLAFTLSGIPLIIIYYRKFSNYLMRFIMLCSIVLCLILGYYTFSHALFVTWIFIPVTYVIYTAIKYLHSTLKTHLFWILITLLIVLFLGVTLLAIAHYKETIRLLMLNNSEPYFRIQLWNKSLELIKKSMLIGFGPGSFLHYKPYHTTHYEAHNLFLDLLLQGGMIGLTAFILFLLNIINYSLKSRIHFLLIITILVFSCFHFTLRQPILWIYFFWAHQVGYREQNRPTAFCSPSHNTVNAN